MSVWIYAVGVIATLVLSSIAALNVRVDKDPVGYIVCNLSGVITGLMIAILAKLFL